MTTITSAPLQQLAASLPRVADVDGYGLAQHKNRHERLKGFWEQFKEEIGIG
ncbi:hypothetical protein [Pseudomonas brassicacearum]|nr:hypothetical protein [Pseudomonas brassicacearum]